MARPVTRSHAGARMAALIAGLAAALAVLAPGQALATHVQCGDVITQDTTLDSDLVNCPGDGAVVGAGGITLDLAGHTIDGTVGSGGRGVDDSAGYDGVTVQGGQIREFGFGVYLKGADGNRVRNLALNDSGNGVWLENADSNLIERNTLSGTGLTVFVSSNDNVIRRNSISGPGTGIVLYGTTFPDDVRRTRIEGNSLVGNAVGILSHLGTVDTLIRGNRVIGNREPGIVAAGAGAVIEQNTVSGNAVGIYVSGQRTHASRNSVGGNHSDGIFVEMGSTSFGTVLERNVANGNVDDGIDADTASTTITRNTANDNGDLGIEAEPGVTDGGGNSARGNGNSAQCLNVSCR